LFIYLNLNFHQFKTYSSPSNPSEWFPHLFQKSTFFVLEIPDCFNSIDYFFGYNAIKISGKILHKTTWMLSIGRFWYDLGHLRSSQQILFHTTCNTPLYEMCLSFDGVDREINLPTRCTPYLHSSLLKVRNCILTLLPFTFVEINFFCGSCFL
jgi:hypothetical protein